MATKWKQDDQIMAVSTELDHSDPFRDPDEDPVLLSGLVGREGVSTLFHYEMRLLSTDHQIQAEQLVGTNATITLLLQPELKKDSPKREINGFINRMKVLGVIKEFRVYEAELVPWIWFMTLQSDCRIFQDMTVVHVLQKMFSEHAAIIDYSGVKGDYPVLKYCVQYRESNFDFVSRLMEENGIFYFFRHEFGRHTLVLVDSNTELRRIAKDPIPFEQEKKSQAPRVTAWKHVYDHRFGRYTHDDYDYEHPKIDLRETRATILKVPRSNPWERYDYPGRYLTNKEGSRLAHVRMQEEEARSHNIEGEGTHAGFEAGRTFTLGKTNDERLEDKKTFVVTAVEMTAFEGSYTKDNFWDSLLGSLPGLLIEIGKGAGGAVAGSLIDVFKGIIGGGGFGNGMKQLGKAALGGIKDPMEKWAEDRKSSIFESLPPGYTNHFFCIPMDIPIRAPRTTRKPEIRGPQTAFVVGPAGEEIWTDELGRVKIKFHWDRHVTEPENASCWIRFSEGWAGKEWGTLHPPRIGQEVIVDFLEADPDRPIVTGRVYHGENKPAFQLPKYQTRSGIKTKTTPHSDKGGYHMLRFEDDAGKEQILLRSQRRTDVRTYASYFETTHANRHLLVGYHDANTDEKGGSVFITVGDEWNLHTGGGRYEKMDNKFHVGVSGPYYTSVDKNAADMVGGEYQLNARKVTIEAKMKISLKVGGSFVVIDPSGVFINGPTVNINSGGAADAAADVAMLDPIDASISDNGEPGYLEHLRELAKAGGGGGHRQRIVSAQHGPNVTRNPDGTLQFSPGIRVDGSDPNYASAVIQDLTTMGETKEGQKLFNNLDASGKQVTIQPGNPPPNPPNAFAAPVPNTAQGYADATPAGQPAFYGDGSPVLDGSGNQMTGTGKGTDSTVTYNPDQWPDPTTAHKAPGDAILFHELTHSDNMEQAKYDGTPRTDNFDTNEEFNTIGPENRYRDERGVPRRTDHHDL